MVILHMLARLTALQFLLSSALLLFAVRIGCWPGVIVLGLLCGSYHYHHRSNYHPC